MPISKTKKFFATTFLVSGMASITGTAAAQDIVDIVVGITAKPLKQDEIILPAPLGGSLSYHVKSNDRKLTEKVRFKFEGDDLVVQNSKEAEFGFFNDRVETDRGLTYTPQPDTGVLVSHKKRYENSFDGVETSESVAAAAVVAGQGAVVDSNKSNGPFGGFRNTRAAVVTDPLQVFVQDDTYLTDMNLQTVGFDVLAVDMQDTVLLESFDDGRLINGFEMTLLPGPQGIPISTTPADNLATITSLLPALPLP